MKRKHKYINVMYTSENIEICKKKFSVRQRTRDLTFYWRLLIYYYKNARVYIIKYFIFIFRIFISS